MLRVLIAEGTQSLPSTFQNRRRLLKKSKIIWDFLNGMMQYDRIITKYSCKTKDKSRR